MKKEKNITYNFVKLINKDNSQYTMSFQKNFSNLKDAIEYAKKNNYTITDELDTVFYKSKN
tara:strand:+ start:246 stop:428 length:183 start_codon:yes stop_codon:yes gene_type:complete